MGELSTERLDLRPFTHADLGPLHELYSDPDAMRSAGGQSEDADHSARRLERLIGYQKELGYSLWAVLERDSASFVGYCGLIPLAHKGPEIEIAYGFLVPYWGKGYATESARAWIAHGFDELGLKRIIGIVDEGNAASRRVLEKIGMTFERPDVYQGNPVLRYAVENSKD